MVEHAGETIESKQNVDPFRGSSEVEVATETACHERHLSGRGGSHAFPHLEDVAGTNDPGRLDAVDRIGCHAAGDVLVPHDVRPGRHIAA
jgi:hypothetical protein